MLYFCHIFVLLSISMGIAVCFLELQKEPTNGKDNFSKNTNYLGTNRRILPSVYDIFKMKKNVITSYPFEIAAHAIDVFCSSTIMFHKVPKDIIPDIEEINFQLITPCKNYTVPLLEAEKLWNLKAFDTTKKVVIFATGWTNSLNDSTALQILSKAFLCRSDVNFIVVDAAKYVDTLYKWAALNTEDIGKHIATGLVHLKKLTPIQNIHLIGHSLGAHIMGAAGRTFAQLTGKLIPRITGLDPAKPCFRRNDTLTSLRKSDAAFVDVIHTNIGILAKREPIGHVDFYVGSASALPPGCFTITCAHTRAVEYFAESVYPWSEHNFVSKLCYTWRQLKQQTCETVESAWMGYVASSNLQNGIYHVDVNWSSPYGKSTDKSYIEVNSKCFLCQGIS